MQADLLWNYWIPTCGMLWDKSDSLLCVSLAGDLHGHLDYAHVAKLGLKPTS